MGIGLRRGNRLTPFPFSTQFHIYLPPAATAVNCANLSEALKCADHGEIKCDTVCPLNTLLADQMALVSVAGGELSGL